MNTERPAMFIATGPIAEAPSSFSSKIIAVPKGRPTELPSPPLSPHQDGDGPAKLMPTNGQLWTEDGPHHYYPRLEQQAAPEQQGQQLELLGKQSQSGHLMPVTITARRYSDTPEIPMPTRDWAKMQTRINTLETENTHLTRTNEQVNQELDKVNGLLKRFTSQDGEGWRKEYEFLVQQVDLMHRQLQSQKAHGSNPGQVAQHQQQDESDVVNKLRDEIKDLTVSLKVWQTAFQQAEEKYRRKCEGERALKQTLREREVRLSGMADKLAGYQNWLQESSGNLEELLRSPVDAEPLERRRLLTFDSASSTLDSVHVVSQSGEQMPGIFPEKTILRPVETTNADQLSVSTLIWASFLAAYMLA